MNREDDDEIEVEAPTYLDGSPVDREEASKVHAGLVSGEMKIKLAPGVEDELKAAGFSLDDIRAMLIASAKKTMS